MKVLNNLDSLNGVLDGSTFTNANARKGINYISATLASSAKWENSKGYPTTWKANTTLTPVDGMTISFKMPSAGHDYGVFLSLDNGTSYYPIGLSPCTNTRLTTHFGNGSTILLQYSSTWQINDMFAVAGSASRSNIVGGWKIISSYLDGNTVSQIREENGRVYAGTNGISPYTMIALDKDGKYQSLITTATTGTGTNKTININAKFKMEPVIRYYNANNTNTNGNLVASTYALYSAYCAVDTRYSHNHTVTFTTNTPLYIECTVDSDGFWSPTTTCITQTLTSGKYYIFLGNTYSTEYQISLSPSHPVYYYNGTTLLDYTSQATVLKAKQDKNGNDITTTYYKASNPNGYTSNTGTVTSVTVKGTSPISVDSESAITTSGTRTISHANSGVTAGTYRSVTVNATGHVTAGTNPTTLSGYGITDAKIASGVITLGSNTITPLTASSTLDATKLSGTVPSGCYTDTKNTAGSTDSSSKLFLVGATSQAANPQTYSQDTVYAGTDGHLYSNSKQAVNLSDSQNLTNKTYEGYTLGEACSKGVIEDLSSSASSDLVTGIAVVDYLQSNGYGPTNVYVGSTTPSSSDIVLWMDPTKMLNAQNGLTVGNAIYLEGTKLFWYE